MRIDHEDGIIGFAMDNTYPHGNDLVFTPDETTTRRYGDAFARLRIFPGCRGPVVRSTSDLIRIGESLKAWPASQFRTVESFGPGEIDAIRDAAERAYYLTKVSTALNVGDRVRFRPSDLCDFLHRDRYNAVGLYPTYVGRVTSVSADGFVEVDGVGLTFHSSEFVAVPE